MSTRHDNADGPEDIDAAFAEIVAGLERDEPMSRWPTEPESAESTEPEAAQAEPEPRETDEGPRDWAPSTEQEDEGHYEPPEPPPLPTPRPSTLGGLAVIGIGLLLLLVPGLAGLGATAALPIGLIAISGGIAWLLFRMRQGPPNSGDDGAQL